MKPSPDTPDVNRFEPEKKYFYHKGTKEYQDIRFRQSELRLKQRYKKEIAPKCSARFQLQNDSVNENPSESSCLSVRQTTYWSMKLLSQTRQVALPFYNSDLHLQYSPFYIKCQLTSILF